MAALGVLSDFSMAVGVPGYLTWHAIHAVSWPMTVLGVTVLSSYGLVLAALLVRFFRANDQVRRQLWVLLAVLIVVVIFALDPILPDSLLSILPIALIPLSITLAVLRTSCSTSGSSCPDPCCTSSSPRESSARIW